MPDWDMVTIPIDPQNPDAAGSMGLTIFAINAQSPNLRAAWEFVKYVNDDEYARVASRSQMDLSSLPSRTKYLKEASNRNIEAFAMQSGNPNKAMTMVPIEFTNIFSKLANTEFRSVLEGKKTVDEALQTIQDKGQEELLKVKKAEQNK
jgi:multiple sugar transport system substrate-binding protein